MDPETYSARVKKASPASPVLKNCLWAFLVGGAICLLGEALFTLYGRCGADEKTAATCVSVTLIAAAAALTGLGVFDGLAKRAGAGTLVPITGFANAVVAPALEYATEGRVAGTAVRMFTIAGPVIVYGCGAASLYGLVYYCFCR